MLICEWCRKEYLNRSHHVTRFCSQSCATKKQYSEGRASIKASWKGITNTGRTRFKKGQNAWNKDTKGLTVANNGSFKKGRYADERHPFWKGDEVGYSALHSWVKRKLGEPKKCEMCGLVGNRKFEWANKSGKYKRDLKDWLRLCTPCDRK